AGNRHPDAGQHGDDGCRRVGAADGWHPRGVLAAEWPRSACRHLRPCRAHPEPTLRLVAGEGDHLVRGSSFSAAVRKAQTALDEFGIEGIRTNIGFLREILSHSDIHAGPVTTSFVDEHLPAFAGAAQSRRHETRPAPPELYPGEEVLRAQLAGTVVELASEGQEYAGGAQLAVLEAMKMQHVLTAPDAVRAVRTLVAPGQVVGTGEPLLVFTRTGEGTGTDDVASLDLDRDRADLEEVRRRHLLTLDEGRPAAITKRHNQNRRTARENIDDLIDPGSFVEYGALAVAAQR